MYGNGRVYQTVVYKSAGCLVIEWTEYYFEVENHEVIRINVVVNSRVEPGEESGKV